MLLQTIHERKNQMLPLQIPFVDQMKADEARHARTAVEQGGAELPQPLKQAMRLGSRVMTETTFRV